jgi:hypothetical protein
MLRRKASIRLITLRGDGFVGAVLGRQFGALFSQHRDECGPVPVFQPHWIEVARLGLKDVLCKAQEVFRQIELWYFGEILSDAASLGAGSLI